MTAVHDIPRTLGEQQILLRLLSVAPQNSDTNAPDNSFRRDSKRSAFPPPTDDNPSSSSRGETEGDVGLRADQLLQFAARHRVLPQLHAAVKRSGSTVLPAEQMEQLREYAQANTGKSLRLAGELRRLIDHFQRAGIPVIAFKGIVLSAQVYGDLSLRDVGDLDLLVRRGDIVRAADLLISLGHRPFFPTATPKETAYLVGLKGRSRERYLLSHCEHHLVVDATGLNVDLHWAMSLREFSVSLDVEGIWNRAVAAKVAGREMLTLGDEDLLIVLCLNGAKDCWDRLDRVCDVARLVARSGETLNWPLVFSHARQAGVARMLRIGLHLASTLLGAPLPDAALAFAEEDARVPEICKKITRSLLNPQPTEPSAPARAAFDLRLRERWSDRFAYCTAHLHPGVGDWAAVPLPDSLRFLHYPIRPFRLAWRHLRRAR